MISSIFAARSNLFVFRIIYLLGLVFYFALSPLISDQIAAHGYIDGSGLDYYNWPVGPFNFAQIILASFLLLLLTASLQIYPRILCFLAAIAFNFYSAPVHSKTNINSFGLIILTLLSFSLIPLDAERKDPAWKAHVFFLIPAMAYFQAGFSKLYSSAAEWMAGSILQKSLASLYLVRENKILEHLVFSPNTLKIISIALVAWELSFFLLVLWPRTRKLMILTGLLFHVSVYFVTGLNFVAVFCLNYLAYVNWCFVNNQVFKKIYFRLGVAEHCNLVKSLGISCFKKSTTAKSRDSV